MKTKKQLFRLLVMIYCVPISLIIGIYSLMKKNDSNASSLVVFIIPLLIIFVVYILVVINIITAVIYIKTSNHLSFKTLMLFKLRLVPFYIVNFACWLVASMVFHIALFIWPIIPFIVAYTYLTMLGTSIYVISKLLYLKESKLITTKQCIIHCLLQITFVMDLIDSIYLAKKEKKSAL